ncbi:MAG TPA: glutaredoxin family protein [Thermomicrobiales bacterium]|nr:glutaredoxin family protein [Thermomicrobiales bacterium]
MTGPRPAAIIRALAGRARRAAASPKTPKTPLGAGRLGAGAPLALTCYGKPDCPLCDKAKTPVARAVRGLPVTVAWVDILSDPALTARWGERIPVVCAGETVLAEGKVSELRLRRALDAELRDRRDHPADAD